MATKRVSWLTTKKIVFKCTSRDAIEKGRENKDSKIHRRKDFNVQKHIDSFTLQILDKIGATITIDQSLNSLV
jgi:hypothetical protein